MNKKQQKKLMIEIIKADETDGLYDSDISKMETTQTAVEWLACNLDIVWEEKIIDLVEQAKQMEKEQIIDAYETGWVNGDLKKAPSKGTDYYNETHNK